MGMPGPLRLKVQNAVALCYVYGKPKFTHRMDHTIHNLCCQQAQIIHPLQYALFHRGFQTILTCQQLAIDIEAACTCQAGPDDLNQNDLHAIA
jgi:hypothetical protein